MSVNPVIGTGYTDRFLPEEDVRALMTKAVTTWDLTGKRVLFIIPDGTRSAPLPLFFRILHELLSGKAAALDFLVALGTHPVMDEEALNQLLGITTQERRTRYKDIKIFNHRWELPETFVTIGTISAEQTRVMSDGMISLEIPVRVNKMLWDYDQIIVCGPVFPHEVAGFSGGNKYFFPGIGGSDVINFTHWLGALITSFKIIGTKFSVVRTVIELAASFINLPKLGICMVVKENGLAGLYIGEIKTAWSRAADLSAQVHIRYVERPFRQVLSVLPEMYDDLWTGAKGMYKLEPVVADGGEVIIFAPHITEVSYTHGHLIDEIGYHVRDYFVKQWERFCDYPWGVLAHSTHLRGAGTYENGIERPRIQVTLATGIPRERCERLSLGYRDPASIHPQDWAGREDDVLLVPHAGETLYRLANDHKES